MLDQVFEALYKLHCIGLSLFCLHYLLITYVYVSVRVSLDQTCDRVENIVYRV
jgi:hypothetical protein